MSEAVLLVISFEAFIAVLVALLLVYRHFVGNKYIESEKRLRLRLNEASSFFKGNSDKVPDFMQKSIGSIGVEGILDELGIDSAILKNPLVKGLIEKYAPKVLEQVTKSGTTNAKSYPEVELL